MPDFSKIESLSYKIRENRCPIEHLTVKLVPVVQGLKHQLHLVTPGAPVPIRVPPSFGSRDEGLGFGVRGLGLGVWGLGFRGLGCRV